MKTNSKLNKNIVGNVKDETFQNQLIRDYLERQFLLEDSDLDKISEINKEINHRIDDSELAENILWLPKTLEFSNMFSYGEGNKVRFENAQGVIGIFAPNASGKSSLFDALSFCIFDKTSRSSSSKNILNNQKDNFYCKFNFEIDGVDYFIERSARWTRKGTNLSVNVNFWKEDAGVTTSLNGEQRRDTNKNIERYLGKFEDFVLTSLSLQGNNALFIDKSQSERKEILSQFIGVDIFDKLYTIAADENRDNATLIKKFKSDDFTSKFAEIKTQLTGATNEYKLVDIELGGIKTEEESLNKDLIRLNSKIVKLNSDNVGIEELEKRKKILSDKETEILNLKNSTQDRIGKLEALQLELEEIIDGFNEDELETKITELGVAKTDLGNTKHELDKLGIWHKSLVDKKEHLDLHKYNPDCNICMENSETILQSKDDVEKTLFEVNEYITTATTRKEELESKVGEYSIFESDWADLMDSKEKETKIDREISSLINKLSTSETEEIRVQTQIAEQTKLIDEYYKNEEQIKKNGETREEIKIVRETLDANKISFTKTNKKLLELNGRVSSLQSQRDTLEDKIKEVKDLEEQSKLYEYYLNALNKDGVSYELIEKSLPMIEGEVNNILAQIVEFGMQLEMDGKNINAYLVYGDNKWSLEMCSGMERFISGLAIRVALINVCNLPRPNFLVIDEGFGTLDSENLQSLFMLFTYLKTQFDFVMIISHIDSMRDVVDGLIEIKKTNGFSYVKF